MIRSVAKLLASIAVGCVVTWLAINLTANDAVVILQQEEAEGPQFSDPTNLDIISHFRRRRVCPATTQRWVWRWTTYRGERLQQAIPLQGTSMPFLSDSAALILTLPNPGVPDLGDRWFFRSVTAEQCGWLPTWLSGLVGTHVFRSADLPVNFVGEPHAAR